MRTLAAIALSTAVAILATPDRASAVLIVTDLLTPGDGWVTRDTETDLDWLDVFLTQNLSYDDVQGGAGGWIADGWRHATEAEVCDLFERHGLVPVPCPGDVSTNGTVGGDLHPFLGATSGFQTGIYDDGDADPRVGTASQVFFVIPPGIQASSAEVLPNAIASDEAGAIRGHYLVRAVPEPGTLVLLLLCVGALGALRQPKPL